MLEKYLLNRFVLKWMPQNNLTHQYRSIATKSSVNRFTERSHHCGELSQEDIGKRVNLFGWVKYTRFDNKIIALRDSYGTVQCVADSNQLLKSLRKLTIHNESVLRVSGFVKARPEKQVDTKLPTGSIEVRADAVTVLNDACKDVPILTRDADQEHTLVNKLKYRYLDIRGNTMQEALRFRSEVYHILRQILHDLNFVECETPTLFRRTPGGANEFIVPTQTSHMFYGLTQSPQQMKQLLMIGGLDRYFQICRCYRDESGRTDRQPEFTQLDIELSFTNQDLIISLIDELIYRLIQSLNAIGCLDMNLNALFNEKNHIDRIDYEEAFRKYGCDKPDLRYSWLIEDSEQSEEIYIDVPYHVDDKVVLNGLEVIQNSKNLDVSRYQIDINHSSNITRLKIESRSRLARQILGQLRLSIASQLEQKGEKVYESDFKFVWVTNFPLFDEDIESGLYCSNHHPFTAPTQDTLKFLKTDPSRVLGQHYDLVLNGQEVAGGSIRVHDADLQQFIFNDILKLDHRTFDYFIKALASGCPPHGGIALGLDRLIALLLNRKSIKDVIAFPKSNVGRDLMSDSPHEIDSVTKRMYNILSLSSEAKNDHCI